MTLAILMLVGGALCAACWLVLRARGTGRASARPGREAEQLEARIREHYRVAAEIARQQLEARMRERAGYVRNPFDPHRDGW